MPGFWTDLRSALRQLRRARGWSAALIATLALGIGASCAVFSLIYAALLRPLPFAQASRLVWVSAYNPQLSLSDQMAVSPHQLQDWGQPLGKIFTDFAWLTAGTSQEDFLLNGVASSPYVRGASANLFSMLGVRPELGRLLRPSDARPGKNHVAVISDAIWRRVFGADPSVIGKTISDQDGSTDTIVGVLPASFRLDRPTGIWFPDVPIPQLLNYRRYYLIGLRRAGTSLAVAQAALRTLQTTQPAAERPTRFWGTGSQWPLQARSLRDEISGTWERPMLLLLLAVGCLLLVACANAAILLLGRIRQREHEIAIRLAVGCSRARLARQLLLECAALAGIAGAIGWALAALGLRALRDWGAYLMSAETDRQFLNLGAGGANATVLGFSVALATGIVVAVGLGPALQAAGFRLTSRLRSERRPRAGSPWLVAGEAAVATLLLVAAGLLVHSFLRLISVNPGFKPASRISFEIDLPISLPLKRFPAVAEEAYFAKLRARLGALPGVGEVAQASGVPLSPNNATSGSAPVISRLREIFPDMVSPGYFSLMGVRLLRGRDFNSGDVAGHPKVIVVNQAFVNAFFRGQNVIGRQVRAARCEQGASNPDPAGCTIIGVIANVHESSLGRSPKPAIYESLTQDDSLDTTFILHAATRAETVIPEIEAVLRHLPDFLGHRPFAFAPRTLKRTVALSVASPRFRTWLAGLLASLALALAAFGIYAVQAYAVARRRHELGVRMALGAAPAGVLRMIVGEALGWTMLGAAVGLAAVLAGGHVLAGMLFHVARWDPATVLGAPALLAAVAAAAAYFPARRAMRVNPVEALRAE